MKYEELTPEQKRDYGFIKLSKQEIRFIEQMDTDRKKKTMPRLMENRRSHLRLIVNES